MREAVADVGSQTVAVKPGEAEELVRRMYQWVTTVLEAQLELVGVEAVPLGMV